MCFLENAAIILALCLVATFILKNQIVRLKKKHLQKSSNEKHNIPSYVQQDLNIYANFPITIFIALTFV
ncbi:hypothetical protein CO695_06505 [Providencia alcalifaciens]|uniref:Uncharacterized protein n=1 Tax=Providencia alcalifaciens DSM 30120 TaxID=520999 RepID=B6XDQ2_9GAMM|nr:hypothetical protein CO695_06505 [Providencia alcalifaciens]EEB46363.1 hypothetical protein PROVALCAL_01476 [Providencia alcalifaciens DSM 30120]